MKTTRTEHYVRSAYIFLLKYVSLNRMSLLMAFAAQFIIAVQIELLLCEWLLAPWTGEAARVEGFPIILNVRDFWIDQCLITFCAFLGVEHTVAILVVVVAFVFVDGLACLFGVGKKCLIDLRLLLLYHSFMCSSCAVLSVQCSAVISTQFEKRFFIIYIYIYVGV